ncbi:hypothetical protein MTR_5g007390 [Medicago truncatula]|uniref:Reverse transcriptase zinc-binding domain-containing protein n=1 Tax=Medicago truncatula TaxID=3880 RepID=G7K559_MEDTR|nr:hypothetical protein MTR_5g007390 [Medicago truncatula]
MTSHFFLHCKVAWKIWVDIQLWLEVNMVTPSNLLTHWRCWDGLGQNTKELKRGFRIIWHASIWAIWKTRNNIIFNNAGIEVQEVVEEIKMLSWKWNLSRLKIQVCLFYEWCWDPKWCMGVLRH